MHTIAITAVIAVGCLISLKFVFDSYYVTMFEQEEYEKVGSVKPKELMALRAAEAKSFAAAPVPLEKAMQMVAHGRGEPMPGLRNSGIMPEQSTDKAALVGWAQTAKLDMADDDEPPPAAPAASGSAAPAGSALPAASGSAAPATAPSGSAAPRPGASAGPAPSARPAPSASAASPAPPPPPGH